jgi:hypothetical protein
MMDAGGSQEVHKLKQPLVAFCYADVVRGNEDSRFRTCVLDYRQTLTLRALTCDACNARWTLDIVDVPQR